MDCNREYDFALVIGGVSELTSEVENALFEAGCDDSTITRTYGCILMEFSRIAPSLKEAIFSAIRDVRNANVGAEVLQVDECNLVTQAEIARRIGKSRQLVHQFITGQRGPGGFPPPACHVTDETPMWEWCAVTFWLCQNDMIRSEERYNSEVVAAINAVLDLGRYKDRNADLVQEVTDALDQLSS